MNHRFASQQRPLIEPTWSDTFEQTTTESKNPYFEYIQKQIVPTVKLPKDTRHRVPSFRVLITTSQAQQQLHVVVH